MNILALYAFGPPRIEADSEIINVGAANHWL